MLASLKLKFKLSLVYWLNSTQFKIESKISFLRNILRNILRFGKFFCYKLPNHVQIYDLGHILGKIITLLNLCLVLLLEQSIVQGSHYLDSPSPIFSNSIIHLRNQIKLYGILRYGDIWMYISHIQHVFFF